MSLKIKGLKDLIPKYKNFFFDLDGVMWWGDQSIPGSLEALNNLRKENKNLFFVTNASIRSRQELQRRFTQFGFKADLHECYPSAYFTGLYLKQKHPNIKNVICFGNEFLAEELRNAGLKVNHATNVEMDNQPVEILDKYYDPSIQGVVVGYDKFMTYAKICLASFHIQKGAKFIGTNPDKFSMVRGLKVPSAGSMLSLIQMASKVQPEIPGKPNTFIIDHIIQDNKLKREQCVMVGDNLDTDIMFGNRSSISTVAVLSSVSSLSDVTSAQGDRAPTYYCDRMGADIV